MSGSKPESASLSELVAVAEQAGLWALQAGIFPESATSIVLLQRCGFGIVGRREQLGQIGGRWHDGLLLKRRSEVAGR